MKRSLVVVAGLSAAFTASAGTVKVDNQDITLGGGAAGGFYVAKNTGGNDQGSLMLSDYLVSLKTGAIGKGMTVAFEGALGNYSSPTVYDGGFNKNPVMLAGIPYGWMTISPMKDLSVEIGQILTTVGYETAHSLGNANILRGMLWDAQPVTYPGVRANYSLGDFGIFAEVNEGLDGSGSVFDDAWAIGGNGKIGKDMSFSVTYLDVARGKNIFDVVGKMKMNGMELGANLDVIMLDKDANTVNPGKEATAIGLAAFVTINAGGIDIPVRLEFTSDGDKSIYGRDVTTTVTAPNPNPPPLNITTTSTSLLSTQGGFGLTVTPTIKAGENGFVRAEFSFTSLGGDYFADKDGAPTKTQMTLGLQGGYRF